MYAKYYDDIVPHTLSDNIYNYCQTLSWYQEWVGRTALMRAGESMSEYIPAEDGVHAGRHFIPKAMGPMGILELLRFSMYRFPMAWGEQSLQIRYPNIYELWTIINDKVFDNGAEVEGLPENIAGLGGHPREFKNNRKFADKYNVSADEMKKGWRVYLNARCAEPISSQPIGNRVGQMHKDSSADVDPKSDRYYTVLYVSNRQWRPDWGGDFLYYDDTVTGAKHWKHNYDIGWPSQIIGNRPGRVIVYPHHQTHMTLPPKADAGEMTQRIAFRVRMK